MFSEKKLKSNVRRSFQITIGLKEGYGSDVVHSIEDVKTIIKDWMVAKMAGRLPTITGGIVVSGTTLYAWNSSATGIVANEEYTALFIGEINPLYNADMSDELAIASLRDLAETLGAKLNQTRMYVSYRDEVRIYQNDGQAHPTGT